MTGNAGFVSYCLWQASRYRKLKDTGLTALATGISCTPKGDEKHNYLDLTYRFSTVTGQEHITSCHVRDSLKNMSEYVERKTFAIVYSPLPGNGNNILTYPLKSLPEHVKNLLIINKYLCIVSGIMVALASVVLSFSPS